MYRAEELGERIESQGDKRKAGDGTIPWNMKIGQRSGLRHLWLVAVRQSRDKFVYVTWGSKAMREKMSFAYGILENGVRCTWGSASCLER